MFRIKYEEVFSYKPNADTSHLLDSLVSALAVYATAFRFKLSLRVRAQFADLEQRSLSNDNCLEVVSYLSYHATRCNTGARSYARLVMNCVQSQGWRFIAGCWNTGICHKTLHHNATHFYTRVRSRARLVMSCVQSHRCEFIAAGWNTARHCNRTQHISTHVCVVVLNSWWTAYSHKNASLL